jgi:hypothetical protein
MKKGFHNRPHPGPLPWERENLSPGSLKYLWQNGRDHCQIIQKWPTTVPSPGREGQVEGVCNH